jgi:hypothetical protein
MKRTITSIVVAAIAFVALSGSFRFFETAQAQGAMVVRTVPWMGLPNKPHEVFSGGALILQGMATAGLTDTAVNGTITSAIWDPGDGGATINVTAAANANSLAIEATKVYTGVDGQPYTATLTVTNNLGQTATDTFKIVVKAKSIDVEANMAIDKGLWYLYKQLNRTVNGVVNVGYVEGAGSSVPSRISSTSAAVQSMQINNHLATSNAAEVPYTHAVSRMLRYLESQILVQVLNNQTAGYVGRNDNPDTNANGRGLYVLAENDQNRIVYTLGQVMDAFVSSGTPTQTAVLGPATYVLGRQYQDIVQDMLDYYAWGQMDTGATQRGSWYYSPSNNGATGHTDNSTSQWAAIGGIAAERVWGLTTPAFVKSELKFAMAYSHNSVGGGSPLNMLGSFGYGNNGSVPLWSEGHSSSPSGMVQEIWIGARNNPASVDVDDVRFREGLKWMARHHRIRNNYAGSDPNFGGINLYALYATTKAYRLAVDATGAPTPITLVDDDTADAVPAWDWYYNDPAVGAPAAAGPRGVARSLLGIAQANGSFVPGGSGYWSGNLGTAWSVIMLSPSLFQLGPTAVCTANPNQIGSFGGAVNFDGTGSFHNDEDGTITSYAWDFGDSTSGTGSTASHTYPASATPNTFPATLTVTDSNGLTDTVSCTVTQVNTNVQPNAEIGGPYSFCQGSPMIVNGSASSDPEDGAAVSFKWDFSNPVNFTPADATTATVDVTSIFGAVAPGLYDIGLQVTDSLGVTNAEFAQITVRAATDPACNQPPVATNNAYATNEDTAVSGNAVTDAPADTDPDADTLTATLITGVSNGGLTFANGAFTYTPNANYCGPDSFTYKVNDGTVDSNIATVTIDVACVNDAPVADDDAAATSEDTPVGGSVTGNDTAADVEGSTLTWTKTSEPANGAVTFGIDGSYTYTPNANFCGTDSFTYEISDGTASDPATVTITVSCVNDAPSADNDSATTDEDTPVSGSVVGNDTAVDLDGDTLSWTSTSSPANGTLTFTNGNYTYTPNANYCGPDSFTYEISDGTATDSATVSITVNCVNDPPVADDDSTATTEDNAVSGVVTGNDTAIDLDGDTLVWLEVTDGANGAVTVNPNGSFTYTPNANFCGTDSFTYTIGDGTTTDSATVTIIVSCVNDAPVADDDSVGTAEDTPVSATVVGNDTSIDLDGDTLVWTQTSSPSNGGLTFANGGYTYTPNANYCGPDSFTYTIGDGFSTDSATVAITVACVNDPPVAVNDAYAGQWNTLLTIAAPGVKTNDSDVDTAMTAVTAATVTGPSHGTVTLNTDGSFAYLPIGNYSGTDSFTYKLNDGALDSNTATVVITITSPCGPKKKGKKHTHHYAGDGDDHDKGRNGHRKGDKCEHDRDGSGHGDHDDDDDDHDDDDIVCAPGTPKTNKDNYSMKQNTTLTISAKSGVRRNDGKTPTTIELWSNPSHGTLTLAADGSFVYTPTPGFIGTDTFYYVARSTGGIASRTERVTIQVTKKRGNDDECSNRDHDHDRDKDWSHKGKKYQGSKKHDHDDDDDDDRGRR